MSKQIFTPAFRAYSVIEREGKEPYWQSLGAAFENTKGGLNTVLTALPLREVTAYARLCCVLPKK